MADISLLVCTRNRASSLPALLHSVGLAVHNAFDLSVEIVIVDNGSVDQTAAVLTSWAARQPFDVSLVDEVRPGLARARNAGLARCKGRIIAMTDDDCVIGKDYFLELARCFHVRRDNAIVGGRILLGDPRDLPVTIKLENHPMIADPCLFPGGFVMGANLTMSADVINKVGLFDVRFGAGAPFLAAEDTDFLFRALGKGVEVRYDPAIVVHHHHGRRERHEETELLVGYSFGDGALYAKHIFSDRRIFKAIYEDIKMIPNDLRRRVTPHAGIRYFYLFRAKHKARGFLHFLKAQVKMSRPLAK